MPDNLLQNGGFEDGAYFIDPVGAVAIPNGWTVKFRGEADPKLPGQTTRWGQPDVGVISTNLVPEHERALFFLDGEHCWKVWTGSSWPFYLTVTQKVNLQVGARYRFVAQAFPDMVESYANGKQYASDPNAAGLRLLARGGGREYATPFANGQTMPYGRYTAFRLDFLAAAVEMEVSVEAYGIYGLANNGYFFDGWSLVKLADPAPASQPDPAPQPSVKPQALPLPAKNLLPNGSFDEGQAYPADESGEARVPAGWFFEFHAAASESLPRPYARPRAELLSRRQAAAADRERLFSHGEYCWRLSGEKQPFWADLFQVISGLAAGGQYRLLVDLLPDFPAGAEAGEVSLTVKHGDKVETTGWQPARSLQAGRYQRLALPFRAAAARAEIHLEIRTAAGQKGGWYVDLVALEPV